MKNRIIVGSLVLSIIAITLFAGITLFPGSSGFIASDYTMSYGAYSTASLLSTFGKMTTGSNLLGEGTYNNLLLSAEEAAVDVDQLNDYYNMLVPFLENGTDDIVSYTDLSDTDPNYEVVQRIKFSFGTGQAQVMTIKYNVGQNLVEIEEEEDYDDEYEVQEIESRFEGVLVLGTNTYDFVGFSEIEGDEEEFELKAVLDSQNYVKMSIEREEGELEYHYEISENGVTRNVEIEIEDEEDREFKIELEIEENGLQKEYTLKKEIENSVEVTKMIYDVDGQEGTIYIQKLAGLDGILGTVDDTVEYTIKEPGKIDVVVEEQIDNDYGEIEDDD